MEINQRKYVEMAKNMEGCKEGTDDKLPSSLKNSKFSFFQPFKMTNKLYLKPILLSFFLFTVGTCFLYLGTTLFLSKKHYDSIPSLILGAFCIIPGSYYSFSILQILRGVSGYSFEELDIS